MSRHPEQMGGSACLMASEAACSAAVLPPASSTPAPCVAKPHAPQYLMTSSLNTFRDARLWQSQAHRCPAAQAGSLKCKCHVQPCPVTGASGQQLYTGNYACLARVLFVAAPHVAHERARAVPLARIAQDSVERVRVQRCCARPTDAVPLPACRPHHCLSSYDSFKSTAGYPTMQILLLPLQHFNAIKCMPNKGPMDMLAQQMHSAPT